MENHKVISIYVIILFFLPLLYDSCNSIKREEQEKYSNQDSLKEESIPTEDNIFQIPDSIVSVFRTSKFDLKNKGRESNKTEYLVDYGNFKLFNVNEIDYLDYYNFIRVDNRNKKIGVSLFILKFLSDSSTYNFIGATNNLISIQPDNLKAPAFFSKKKDILYLFRPNSFAHLKDAKIMKALCDSLVIQPDTADIRMANECIYNQRMDTYYKTRPWREEMKNY